MFITTAENRMYFTGRSASHCLNDNYDSFSFSYAAIAYWIQNCFLSQAGSLETSLGTSTNVMQVLYCVMHTWLKSNKDTFKKVKPLCADSTSQQRTKFCGSLWVSWLQWDYLYCYRATYAWAICWIKPGKGSFKRFMWLLAGYCKRQKNLPQNDRAVFSYE